MVLEVRGYALPPFLPCYDKFLSVNAALKLSRKVEVVSSQKEVFEKCDYLTIHVPFNPQTKGFINTDAISLMKDGVRILNFARGELVDTTSILSALKSGKVSCYVTDFPNADVIGVENVVALPHLGASTPESEDNCAVMAAEELIDYIENGNIRNSVNFPNAEMVATGEKICIIHKNVPDTISKITSVLGANGVNIENMISNSKKDYAYTIIDATGKSVDADTESKIASVENVIRVRVIR